MATRPIAGHLHQYWQYYVCGILCGLIAYATGINNPDLTNFYVPWGEALMRHGLGRVYANSNCDYPPMLVYPFWLPAWLTERFQITSHHWIGFLYKLLPTAGVIGSGLLAVRVARLCRISEYAIRRSAMPFVLFNPALLLVSAVWGQTDSIVLVLLLAVLELSIRRNLFGVCFLSMIGFLSKPQMIFALPFLAIFLLEVFPLHRIVLASFAAVAASVALCLPLIHSLPADWLLTYYLGRPGTYRVTTMHAGTLPGLIGGNYRFDGELVVGSLSVATVSLITLGIFACAYIIVIHRSHRRFSRFTTPNGLLTALALSTYGVYYFSSRMHERYVLYGAVLCGLAGIVGNWRADVRWVFVLGLSFVSFFQMSSNYPLVLADGWNTQHLWARIVQVDRGFTMAAYYQMAAMAALSVLTARYFLRPSGLRTDQRHLPGGMGAPGVGGKSGP